jgi:hypothetical protein
MDGHENFERILQSRYVPSMRSNLPERIIAASLTQERKAKPAALGWFSDFWDGFVLPQPVFAMAIALVIGVMIGMGPEQNDSRNFDFMTQTQAQADLGDML